MSLVSFTTDINGFLEVPALLFILTPPRLLNLTKVFNPPFILTLPFIRHLRVLRKGVYLYEYMGSWERFDETSLPDKEAF